MRKQIKLLLLGTGESGKSTIFKQMKILQVDGGFSEDELSFYKKIILSNCVTQMKTLIVAANKSGEEFDNPDNKEAADTVSKLMNADDWTPDAGKLIKLLWKDSCIQKMFQKKDKQFQLDDSASYLFDSIDRFNDANFKPNDQDVLRARSRTTGIEEAVFKFEDMSFRLIDVGGQRSERRKWIHCFDCVSTVIFCVALSEYDQVLREDLTQNRMKESLLLFDEICNSEWFKNIAFILFFNKMDLFKEKINKVDLSTYFPNYTGGTNYDKASEFIAQRFLELNTSPHKIFHHFTCAVDPDHMEFVFAAVRKTILTQILDTLPFTSI